MNLQFIADVESQGWRRLRDWQHAGIWDLTDFRELMDSFRFFEVLLQGSAA
jgi:hypothetical protein